MVPPAHHERAQICPSKQQCWSASASSTAFKVSCGKFRFCMAFTLPLGFWSGSRTSCQDRLHASSAVSSIDFSLLVASCHRSCQNLRGAAGARFPTVICGSTGEYVCGCHNGKTPQTSGRHQEHPVVPIHAHRLWPVLIPTTSPMARNENVSRCYSRCVTITC